MPKMVPNVHFTMQIDKKSRCINQLGYQFHQCVLIEKNAY